MTAQIHCNKSIIIGQVRIQLPAPAAPTLRKTMNEKNWASLGVTCLDEMELSTSATNDSMTLHHFFLLDADRLQYATPLLT
jgi:hypothetical protein